MEKEKIAIANYQRLAMKTCLPSAKNYAYAHFGMLAEVRELEAKIVGEKAKKIRDDIDFDKIKSNNAIADEIGDCYWFIALMCELTDYKFSEVLWNRFTALKMSWTFYRRAFKFFPIKQSYALWKCISNLEKLVFKLGFIPSEILQRNIDKLASRAERGVLKGSGDNR